MKYIDADKLTKAIEEKGLDCSFALKMERLDTLALIDSLQQDQPEVDLDREIKKMLNSDYYKRHIKPSPFTIDIINYTARHFYELGLNARKEE